MSEVLDKIKSRGYWNVLIRPQEFKRDRIVNHERAFEIVRKCAVLVGNRGWTFPRTFRDDDEILSDEEWVGQELDWHIHVEMWRLYLSGQFVYLGGIWDDWLDQSLWSAPPPKWAAGMRLLVGDVLFRFMEVFEFAARIALTEAGADRMYIELTLHGLKERALILGLSNRAPFDFDRKLKSDKCSYSGYFEREALISQTNQLALIGASQIFAKYNWDAPVDLIRTIQKEIIGS